MDYSQLSDLEINKRVAIATGQNIKFIFLDDDDNEIGVLVGRKGCREKKDFDPCNNPADAWPIIVENKLSMYPIGKRWGVEGYEADDPFYYDSNSLRAAMIVFLMMQDAKHA